MDHICVFPSNGVRVTSLVTGTFFLNHNNTSSLHDQKILQYLKCSCTFSLDEKHKHQFRASLLSPTSATGTVNITEDIVLLSKYIVVQLLNQLTVEQNYLVLLPSANLLHGGCSPLFTALSTNIFKYYGTLLLIRLEFVFLIWRRLLVTLVTWSCFLSCLRRRELRDCLSKTQFPPV